MIDDSVVSWVILTILTFSSSIALFIKGVNEKEKYKKQNEEIFMSIDTYNHL